MSTDITIHSRKINFIIFILLYIFVAYLIGIKPINSFVSDYWMHAGSIEIFSQNLANPQHTYDEAEAIRVRNFSPYQAVLALMVRLFDLTPIDAFTVGSCISVGLLFVGVWFMGNRLGTSPWLPSGLLISILFIVGKGFEWSQEVYARSLPYNGGYPSTISIALSLICWYHVDTLLQQRSWKRFFWIAVLTALVFLIHQLVFLHFAFFLFFWVVMSTAMPRHKVYVLSASLAGLALVLLWPYFSPFSVSYAAVTGSEHRFDLVYSSTMRLKMESFFENHFYSFHGVKKAFGPALLGFFLLPVLPSKVKLRMSFLVLFALFMWFVPLQFDVPASGRRWAMSCMLLLQFVIGIQIAKACDLVIALNREQIWRGIIGIVSVFIIMIFLVLEARQIWSEYSRYMWPPHNTVMSRLERWERFSRKAVRFIDRDGHIAADVKASYAMTALQLQPVVFSRRKNVINNMLIQLYDKKTSADVRYQILKRLDVQYFIVESGQFEENIEIELRYLGEEILREENIILYKVKEKYGKA